MRRAAIVHLHRRFAVAGGVLVLAAACSKSQGAAPAPVGSVSAAASAPAPAASMAAPHGIAFIENDYAAALAKARAEKKPIFIDTWAPWCHTCMSMRSYVFPDPKMQALANDFVWLAVDFEREDNAKTLAKFPNSVLPTLWVVDPETENPVLKWAGAATVDELEALLYDARDAVKGRDSGGVAAAAFLRGNHATAAGNTDEAIADYKQALAAAPPDWKRRGQVVEALSMVLDSKKAYEEQLALATAELPKLGGTSLANVLQNALSASYSLPKGSAGHGKLRELADKARAAAADRAQPMLADDRSGIYEHVVEALHDDDPKAAHEVAREWAAFLEGESAKAKTPEARAVFDSHRLAAYIALGEPARAVPMLEQSERDLPTDYNPPARLARAYLEQKKLDDALAAVDRALAKAYGPRKLQIYVLKADIQGARGDKAGARATLTEAAAQAHAGELQGRYVRVRDDIDRRLAKAK